MERYCIFMGTRNQYCENDFITRNNLQVQYNLYQITNGIFHRTRQKISQFIWKHKRPRRVKAVLRKKKWSSRNQASWLQVILQSYSHQDSMILAQKEKYRPMEQDRSWEIYPCTYGYLIFYKEGKNMQWGKDSVFINGAGKTGQLHVKQWN